MGTEITNFNKVESQAQFFVYDCLPRHHSYGLCKHWFPPAHQFESVNIPRKNITHSIMPNHFSIVRNLTWHLLRIAAKYNSGNRD